ncbi:hypothetical protein HZC08_01835 [Candidatus Micrarchaeota archaeon]|nr:hypothetical protein [Candidatus Micrarchaeota archaeon]
MTSRIYRPGYLSTKRQFPVDSLAEKLVGAGNLQIDRLEEKQKLRTARDLTTGKLIGISMEYAHYKVSFTGKGGFKIDRKPTQRSGVIKVEIVNQWDPASVVVPVCLFRQEVLRAARTNLGIAELVRENASAFKSI